VTDKILYCHGLEINDGTGQGSAQNGQWGGGGTQQFVKRAEHSTRSKLILITA
jgi:hypothetical protein